MDVKISDLSGWIGFAMNYWIAESDRCNVLGGQPYEPVDLSFADVRAAHV